MRRFKTGFRILLILAVINFALAAPIGEREISEVHVDVADVASDGTAASQKLWEPWGQSLKNAPDCKNAPPSPGWSHVENRVYKELEPQISGSSSGSNSEPSKLTPSKRPLPESTGDALSQGSSLIDDSQQSSSTKWSSDEYSPSWTKGSTEGHSSSSTKWTSDENSPSWSKGSTDKYSPAWTKEYSPSWSTDEYSPSWTEGSTDKSFPSSSSTKWSSDEVSPSISSTKWTSGEYSSSWSKESTDEHSPAWIKESTKEYSPSWSTDEYSPSWSKGSTDKSSLPSSSTKWSSDEYSPPISLTDSFPSWSKGWSDKLSPPVSSTKYSPSWTKGSTDKSSPLSSSTKWSDEYSPSWTKGSTNTYFTPTSWLTGDSHPPNPGLTEGHPLPVPGPSTGAYQSTNDHPPPPSPEPQHPAAPESEYFISKLLKGTFRIPRHISGSGAVHAVQRGLVGNR